MKGTELIEFVMEAAADSIVIEMPNGTQTTTTGCYFGLNKKGENVLIITAGRKLTGMRL